MSGAPQILLLFALVTVLVRCYSDEQERPVGKAEALQHRASTLIRCGFQEFPTIASQEKKHGKSQKHETHNRSTSVLSSPQMKVCFQQFFPFLFFLLASQTEDSFKSLLT